MNFPGVTILPFNGIAPRIHESAFIAPGCRIIGDVEIGAHASIWYNCVLRGDVNRIVVGARSNIQDGSVIHCDSPGVGGVAEGYPALIGENVLIGHMAMIHGCVIEDTGFVGMSATVMNGARIEGGGMLAAGAMLTPNKTLPARQLWSGIPARFVRELTDEALAEMQLGVDHYVANGQAHKAALAAAGL